MKFLRKLLGPVEQWDLTIPLWIVNAGLIIFLLSKLSLIQAETDLLPAVLGSGIGFILLNSLLIFEHFATQATFDAALRAMVQLQIIRTMSQFFSLVSQLLRQVQAFIILVTALGKQDRCHPFIKTSPLSALPYELFPQSCLLLN